VAPINTRAADIVNVIRAARRKAEDARVTDLILLGDIFDTVAPEPQLVAELSSALASTVDLSVHIIVGNHDQASDQAGDHALISLDGHRNIAVYDKPKILTYDGGGSVYLVPYRPGRADDYLPTVVAEMRLHAGKTYGPQVLALHLGLRAPDTEPWLAKAHDSYPAADIASKLGEFDLVVAGNWHGRHEVLPGVWQCGALVPTGFDNPGWTGYGSLLIYDGRRVQAAELDGPRFIKVYGVAGAREALDLKEDRADSYPVYLSIRCAADEREEVRELLDLYGHTTYELTSDKEIAESAARSAALAATKATPDGIRAAITAYVDRMVIPEGVDRTWVLAAALDYAAGGA